MRQAAPGLSLRVICAWLFVSAFYYAQTLFSGEFVRDLDEGFAHKFAKYLVCAAISAYLILRARNVAAAGFSLATLVVLAAHLMVAAGGATLFATTLLTLITMAGLSCTMQVYPHATRTITRAVVWSAALVGCLSAVELTLLADQFVALWAVTGGIRSISTMFNPNNLGLYLGAALLLLPWAALSRRTTVALAIPMVFGLGASGSRTAWVSLAVCLLVLTALPRAGRGLRRGLLRYKWILLAAVAVVLVAATLVLGALGELGIDSENRGVDLYTASIRWEHFVEYLGRIDDYSLMPDWRDERTDLIQDNVYLVLFNTFGVVGCAVILAAFAATLRPGPSLPDDGSAAWALLLGYYLVAGLSMSFISAFPNNQLFFIALGGVFVPRAIATRPGPHDAGPAAASSR